MNSSVKKMLIDATHQNEEIRVATTIGNRLEDLDIEHPNKDQKKSNIYLAVISRIEPSLEAVFVNYGANRHGFLPLKEIESSYFLARTDDPKSDIKKILKEGQELLIQVEKEERGNKGAALTTYISLAGCYLVLMPNNSKAGGISRRIEGEDRDQMKQVLNSLTIPDNMGVIIRTAGLGKSIDNLQWDLDVLLHHWHAIKNAAGSLQAPCLLHQESNIIIRAIRDNLRPDIKEILINNEKVYEQAKQYMELLRTDSKNVVKHYNNPIPLFTKFQIESQIEDAYQHEIRLPSGGSIVFDRTEALTAIDINSAQSTKGQDIENTALNTNLEAAVEIARQLRLRDVGGLIVIDFIDMSVIKNQREVENRLREALQVDRARIQISRISRFGLLEMSRQRLKSSLGESTQVVCNKCSGKGSLRTIESLSLSLIRIIEEEALKANTSEVHAQLPLELCTFLANEKRETISKMENNYDVRIVLIPNQHYEFPNYKITRIKSDEGKSGSSNKSYNIIEDVPAKKYVSPSKQASSEQEVAAVQHVSVNTRSMVRPNKPSLLKRLWSSLFESESDSKTKSLSKKPVDRKHQGRNADVQLSRQQRGKNAGPVKTKKRKGTPGSQTPSRHGEEFRSEHHQQNIAPKTDKQQNKQKQRPNPNKKGKHQQAPVIDNAAASDIFFSPATEGNQSRPHKHNQNETRKPNPKQSHSRLDNTSNEQQIRFEVEQSRTDEQNNVKNIRSQNNTQSAHTANEVKSLEKPLGNTIEVALKPELQEESLQANVFVKNNARTKIQRNEHIIKRRFHPKKKLPYEIDKNSDSSNESNVENIRDTECQTPNGDQLIKTAQVNNSESSNKQSPQTSAIEATPAPSAPDDSNNNQQKKNVTPIAHNSNENTPENKPEPTLNNEQNTGTPHSSNKTESSGNFNNVKQAHTVNMEENHK